MLRQACLDSGVSKNLLGAKLKEWQGKEKDKGVIRNIIEHTLKGEKLAIALIGDYNSGKSYLSVCMAKTFIKNKVETKIINFKELMDLFESKRFNDIFYKEFIRLKKYGVLIFDSISTTVWNSYGEWTRITFLELIKSLKDDSDVKLLVINIDMDIGNGNGLADKVGDDFGVHFVGTIMRNFVPYKLHKVKLKEDKKWEKILK